MIYYFGTLNVDTNEIKQVWGINTIKSLIQSYLTEIWIGFNSDHYDKILAHGILTDKLRSVDQAFNCSNDIIHAQDLDIPLFNTLKKYGMSDYYSSPLLSYDVLGDGAFFSLKQLEGFMGMSIVESVVPFDYYIGTFNGILQEYGIKVISTAYAGSPNRGPTIMNTSYEGN